jgi:hypothetical protein
MTHRFIRQFPGLEYGIAERTDGYQTIT